tara:strand:+ start:551 stop:1009 length:459 start_codon:yes stop_codon:yes gene_type:complete
VIYEAKLKLDTHFLGGFKKGKDGIRRVKTTYSGQIALNENELRKHFELAAKQLDMDFDPKTVVFTEGFESECSIIRRTYNRTNVEFFEGIEQGNNITLEMALVGEDNLPTEDDLRKILAVIGRFYGITQFGSKFQCGRFHVLSITRKTKDNF